MPENNGHHIHLFGNPAENFRALGQRDKNSFTQVYDHISMLCMRNNMLAKLVKKTTEFASRFSKNNPSYIQDQLAAYAEGLGRPVEDVLFAHLLPEMVASFNKWAPNLVSLIPGCSSVFYWDAMARGVIHARLLDYALSGPFENFERSVLYDFKNYYKVFAYTSAGFSLPGLSAMNEKGLSVALHYKHSDYFNQDGESIFAITSQLLFECQNISEAYKFLRKKESISFWGLYLADAEGEVLSFDICGSEYSQERFDLKDHHYLYFNNRSLLKKSHQEELQPYGNKDQCSMRYRSFKQSFELGSLNMAKDKTLEIVKQIGRPVENRASDAKNWNLPATTPSTIQFYSFHTKEFRSVFVKGNAPKMFNDHHLYYKDIFSKLTIETTQQNKEASKYQQAYTRLAHFQSHLDKNEIPEAYHEIQMAIQFFKGFAEEYISQFYFYVIQYIFESDERDLSYLYEDFRELEDKLPAYLEDQRKLFLLRLGILLGHEITDHSQYIQNKKLKELYLQEKKFNSLTIKGLRYLTFPRIEILDIIYAY